MNSSNRLIYKICSISKQFNKPRSQQANTGVESFRKSKNGARNYSDDNKQMPFTITFTLPTNIKTVAESEKSSILNDSNRGTLEDGRVNVTKDGKSQSTTQHNSDTHLYDVGANVQM